MIGIYAQYFVITIFIGLLYYTICNYFTRPTYYYNILIGPRIRISHSIYYYSLRGGGVFDLCKKSVMREGGPLCTLKKRLVAKMDKLIKMVIKNKFGIYKIKHEKSLLFIYTL